MAENLNKTRLFHCKPFSLSHHNSSMRVGTDAILLGLFAGTNNNTKVFEIGTGSGIISLIIASRFNVSIDAIDIDKESVMETKINFSNSAFWRRLNVFQADFTVYSKNTSPKYNLIVSNPPFFVNDYRPENDKKKTTRHTDSLSYEEICNGSIRMLKPDGKLCLVLPYNESRFFIEIANEIGLYLQNQQLIFPKRGLQPNRINMQFGFEKTENVQTDRFTIREDDGSFSMQYVDYLKDCYIGLK